MVTGDNLITAKAIARECNILNDDLISKPDAVMEGPEFYKRLGGIVCRTCKNMSPCNCKNDEVREGVLNLEAFKSIRQNLRVLARSRPEDKYLLVTGLRELGDVVGVTGAGLTGVVLLANSSAFICASLSPPAISKAQPRNS
jgi:Ca2+ transporting ATPase